MTFGVRAVVVVLAAVCGSAFSPPRLRKHKLCADVELCGWSIIARVVDGVRSVCIYVFVVLVRADRHIVVRKVAVCERNLGHANLDRHFKRVHNLLFGFHIAYVNGHRSFESCRETCKVTCRRCVFVSNVVDADVAVYKRELHRVGQFVCADVCKVIVVNVFFGHTGHFVVHDVDVSAVIRAVRLADERVGDGGILARIGIQIFEIGVAEQEFCVHNRTVKHRNRYVDALFCEHISLFVRKSEVRVGLLLVLDVVFDCDVSRVDLVVVGDIGKYVAAVCFLYADERSRHISRIALSALDEFVNVGPVEVRVEHVPARRRNTHLVGKMGSVFVTERIHHNRAILVVGHKHNASAHDVHFDFARFDVVVLSCVVLVRHSDFVLLAEVGSNVVVECLIVEVVFDRNVLRVVAAADFDFLQTARFKERADLCLCIRVEVVLLSLRKTRDTCAFDFYGDVHVTFEHDVVAVLGSYRESHIAVEATLCGVVVAPRKRDGDRLCADFDVCALWQTLIEVVFCNVDCKVACLVVAGDFRLESVQERVDREVVVDGHDVVAVNVLTLDVYAENTNLASETALFDFIRSRH